MRIAVCTLAFNEPQYIAPCIKQWEGLVGKHLVLVSDVSWNGTTHEDDPTAEIAGAYGADVVVSSWTSEAEQRNYGLELLKEYDYVLIVDADEFYTRADREKIITTLTVSARHPGWTPTERNKMLTYWKTHEYIFDPQDQHIPTIAVDPKLVTCTEHRQFRVLRDARDQAVRYNEECGEIGVQMHHFSWVKTDEQVLAKIQAYSHADIVGKDWYDTVWLKWTPGDMKIRPYGVEQSIATHHPAPQEIIDLIANNQ